MSADDGLAAPFDRFAEALLDPGLPVPADLVRGGGGDLARRFAIHRTGVRRVWREALAARFPVTEQLVDAEFFAAAADLFLEAFPPLSPVVGEQGAEFPAFLASFPPLADLPLVADVARLEQAIAEASTAAEAAPLPLSVLAGEDPARLADARLGLHPSVRLVETATPARSVWHAHQGETPPAAPADWQGEHTLILRPDTDIRIAALGRGEAAFVAALRTGAAIATAAAAGQSDPAFAIGAALPALFTRGAVVQLVPGILPSDQGLSR